MNKRFDYQENLKVLREKIIGLGEQSTRKSYYPELQNQIADLERFRALVDQTKDGIFLIEIASGRFTDINKSACTMLGYTRAELLSMTVFQVFEQSKEGIIREYLLSGEADIGEREAIVTQLVSCDGHLIPVEITLRVVSFNQTSYFVAVARDITERILAEEELRKKIEENRNLLNEIVEYDKLKTAFFANISHEFKTPLNVILSTLQLVTSYRKICKVENCEEKMDKYIKIMKQNCFRLLKLINNLIDITRIDSGFINLELANHNIVSLVEETTLSVAEYIKNNNLTLEFDTNVEEKIIACDADKIERIVLNLLSNAMKFTKPGGNVWVYLEDRNDKVVISVKDNGIGIPSDKAESIFERFRQVNLTLTRDHEGSGIGLSLVKSLVEMHQGKIYVESEYGKGSNFIVELPVKVLEEDNTDDEKKLLHQAHLELKDIEFWDIY